jgi:hypothetical protein
MRGLRIVIGKRFLLLSLSIVILGALVLEASAQQGATATLSGAVKDSNGALVTGALVTVTQQGTGIRREATSNGDGFFVITNFTSGSRASARSWLRRQRHLADHFDCLVVQLYKPGCRRIGCRPGLNQILIRSYEVMGPRQD